MKYQYNTIKEIISLNRNFIILNESNDDNYVNMFENYKDNEIIIICNFTNIKNIWDNTFTNIIDSYSSRPKENYLNKIRKNLGDVDFIHITPNIFIANAIVSYNIIADEIGNAPINYGALRIALSTINNIAYRLNASIHIPKYILRWYGCSDDNFYNIVYGAIDTKKYIYES